MCGESGLESSSAVEVGGFSMARKRNKQETNWWVKWQRSSHHVRQKCSLQNPRHPARFVLGARDDMLSGPMTYWQRPQHTLHLEKMHLQLSLSKECFIVWLKMGVFARKYSRSTINHFVSLLWKSWKRGREPVVCTLNNCKIFYNVFQKFWRLTISASSEYCQEKGVGIPKNRERERGWNFGRLQRVHLKTEWLNTEN